MNVNEVFKLVHEGRAPSAGEDDGRYILSGRGKLADVRVWPGLRIDRKWWVPSSDGTNQIEIPVENWVEEGTCGPVFFSKAILQYRKESARFGFYPVGLALRLSLHSQHGQGDKLSAEMPAHAP